MCVCVCACVCVRVCAFVCVCVFVCMCEHVEHVHMHVHTRPCKNTHARTHTHTITCIQYARTHFHAYAHTYVHIRTHKRTVPMRDHELRGPPHAGFLNPTLPLSEGVRWQQAGTIQPTRGRLLTNVKLSNALLSRTEFTPEQWAEFGVEVYIC